MQKTENYKQTEVGLIPKEWEVVSLSSLSEKIMVGIASAATHAYRDKGVVLFRNQNIKPNFLDDSDILFVAEDYEQQFKNKRLQKGDLLTARTGYPGTTCVIPEQYENAQSFTTLITRPDKRKINPYYLSYYINSERGIDFFERSKIGGGQKNVNAGILKEMPIILPPLPEQTAIASALSDMDALIAQTEKLIEKKKAIKQGVMQELLQPKEGWVKTCLYELADGKKSQFDDGDWIESEFIIEKGVRLIQTGNIGVGRFLDKDSKKYISEESFVKLNCKEVLQGDLLICRLAEPAGRACIMPFIGEEKVITSVDVSIFRGSRSKVNREFLSQLFTTQPWFQKVLEKVGGTTHKRISRGSLAKIELIIPSIEEQNRIAETLFDMDQEILVFEQKNEKLKLQKQGMMQALLTGKIRLV